jgi:glycosyltransferase involved in cell wall biosynthesis
VQSETLSVILPVSNRQQHVAASIESLLDTLSELTNAVQLIVVDDASKDATPEILDDLRRHYPQVTTLRTAKQLGPSKAVESALSRAVGDFIFLHESYEPLELDSLKHLWALRHDRELVIARAATRSKRIDEPLLQRLTAWGKSLEEHWKRETKSLTDKPLEKGLQMIRRDAVESLARVDPKRGDLEVSHLSQRRLVRSDRTVKRK